MIKKIWSVVTTVLIAALILLAFLLAGVRLLGLQVYTVLSGSMEPEYRTGSVIYVRQADTDTLEAGDVITFRLSGSTIATHRIIEVIEEDGRRLFRTKGDANDVEDASPVSESNVIGTPVFTIPNLGFFAAYIQTPSGRYLALAVGSLILLLVLLPELLFKEKNSAKKAAK